jgi:hypothetical protein
MGYENWKATQKMNEECIKINMVLWITPEIC